MQEMLAGIPLKNEPRYLAGGTGKDIKRRFCARIGRLAVRSLYQELVLYPKPGLVSMVDCGSHADMTAITFMRSIFTLRHYFIRMAAAGYDDAPFTTLKRLGLAAERQMLAATAGINTHRGAIFCLGLLCAAIGRCRAQHIRLSPAAIRATLLLQWGDALYAHSQSADIPSHGREVALLHSIGGAREEAAQGFPSIFEIALPAFQKGLSAERGWQCAAVDALFSLMANIKDTNIYHRAGKQGARIVQGEAQRFLQSGATSEPGWKARALECHRLFMRHQLSPGGAADLLAGTFFVHQVVRSS